MILDNYKFLKNNIINLHNILKNNPYNPESAFVKYDDVNKITFTIDENAVNIFSKENPSLESNFILDSYDNLENRDEIILFGIGDGSIIKEIDKRVSKSTKIFVVDFMQVFQVLLSHYSFKEMSLERVASFTLMLENMNTDSFLNSFIGKTNGNFELIILPQYIRLFKDKISVFMKRLSDYVKTKRKATNTNQAFEKRWIINSIKNFNHVLSTANFLDLKTYDFTNSAALIVSAGPSLDIDIEYIKKISKDDKVYIFGVGSANKTLMKHGIKPDAIFTYDPSHLNQHVIKKYSENTINAPIVFGSSVGYETLEPINEKFKYHILISQDKLSSILLEEDFKAKGIMDSPTIAIITLQTLIKLKFSTILFAGQNLGFYEKKRYSSAVNYSFTNPEISESELKQNVIIKDVYNNDMYTNESFNLMRIIIQKHIKVAKNTRFINTTKFGANIEGTEYIEIEEVYPTLTEYNKPVDLWTNSLSNKYDMSLVYNRYKALNKERIKCGELLISLDKSMKEIKDKLKASDYVGLKGYDRKVEDALGELLKNNYFNQILKLMNRTYYGILINNFSKIKNEKIYENKYKMIYKKIGPLIVSVMQDYNKIINDFMKIKKFLDERCGNE